MAGFYFEGCFRDGSFHLGGLNVGGSGGGLYAWMWTSPGSYCFVACSAVVA